MNSKKHYYWIDLLRFVSALLVVLVHYRANFFVEYRFLPDAQKNIFTQIFFFITRLGEESVLVFFILSGFLVGGKAVERIIENKAEPQFYFIDRFTRILLPLIASSLLVIITDLITNVPIPFKDIIGSIFSLQGTLTTSEHNSPLWSLAYEVWFYILIGCLMVISVSRGKNLLLAYIVLTISIYVFLKLKTLYLLILFMGTLSFLLPPPKTRFIKGKIFILLALLVFSFVLLQSTSESRSLNISIFNFINRDMARLFLAFIACLLVRHITIAEPKTKTGIKAEKISSKLSAFSYSLYLSHYPVLCLLLYWGFPKSSEIGTFPVLYFLSAIFISLAVAFLLYLISEKQTERVKKLIKEKIKNIRA